MTTDELAAWWLWFRDSECRGYSGQYEAICSAVAESERLLDRLTSLPGHAQQPNMLLAAVHDLVLRGGAPALAERYETGETAGVGQVFVATALDAWNDLVPTLEARRTQTNEIGRVALLAPALATVALGDPFTLVDVGTSAGLTLLLERCHIDYGPMGRLGPDDSPVRVSCEVLHGAPPIRSTPVERRLGIDRSPLDLSDPDNARWLIACTWPDTGRLARTRAAVALGSGHPTELRTGDAVDDLPGLLDEITGPVVVTTTWALAYLSERRRAEFADALAAASRSRPVVWISGEGHGVVAALPSIDPPEVDVSASVLGLIRYDEGRAFSAQVLAHVHPHGHWLWWYDR